MDWNSTHAPTTDSKQVPKVPNPFVLLHIAHGACPYHKRTRNLKTFRVPEKTVVVFVQPDTDARFVARPEMFGNDTTYMAHQALEIGGKGKRTKVEADASANLYERMTRLMGSGPMIKRALAEKHQMGSRASYVDEFRYKSFFPGQFVPDTHFHYKDPRFERLGLYHYQTPEGTFRPVVRLSDTSTLRQVARETRASAGSDRWLVLFTISCLGLVASTDNVPMHVQSARHYVSLDGHLREKRVDPTTPSSRLEKRKREPRRRLVHKPSKRKGGEDSGEGSNMSRNEYETASSHGTSDTSREMDPDVLSVRRPIRRVKKKAKVQKRFA